MLREEFLTRLDNADNESEVRIRVAAGDYSEVHKALAQEWLRKKEEARNSAAATKRDDREEKTLAIAADALAIAKEANRIAVEDLEEARKSAKSAADQAKWAMWAAIIASVAALGSVNDQFFNFVLWVFD